MFKGLENGPFKSQKYKAGNQVKLSAKNNHWLKGNSTWFSWLPYGENNAAGWQDMNLTQLYTLQ
jgi:hypothetical protein